MNTTSQFIFAFLGVVALADISRSIDKVAAELKLIRQKMRG